MAQAGAPYGGTLLISDPMNQPGPDFNWDTGSDGSSDQCNFEDGAYHVSGYCHPHGSTATNIPPKFAFQIYLAAIHSCGEIDFKFSQSNDKDIRIDVCQNGDYYMTDFSGDTQQSSYESMSTGSDQSNIIDVVADGTNITLYINSDLVTSIPDNNIYPGNFYLGGEDLDIVLSKKIADTSDYREVIYAHALLWSLMT